MDDPTQRPPVPQTALPPGDYRAPDPTLAVPPQAYPPPQVYAPQPYPAPYPAQVQVHAVVPSLPGMQMPQMVAPGVSVQISNVVAPAPMMMAPPYAAPYPAAPPAQPSVVDMMRVDASQKAMDAVARRGPARVLGFLLGTGASLMLVALMVTLAAGASGTAVAIAAVPLSLVAVVGFVIAVRAGRGVDGHHLERSILELASKNQGIVRVVALAQATGRPLRECQTAIDAMVSSGHATVEADEGGSLLYRIPDLEPRRRALVTEVR